jgi:hypothetical protein
MHSGDIEVRLREVLRAAADRASVHPGAAQDVIRRAQPVRVGLPLVMAAMAIGAVVAAGAIVGRSEGQEPAGFGSRNNRSGLSIEATPGPTPTVTPTPQLSPSPEPENPPWQLIDSGTISGEPWKLMYFPGDGNDLCPQFGLGYNNEFGAAGFTCPAKIDHLMVVQAAFEDFPEVAPVFGVVTGEVDTVDITLEGSNEAATLPATIHPGPEEVDFDYFLAFIPSALERGYVTARTGDGEFVRRLDLCMAEYIQTYGIDPMPLCQRGR